MQYGINVVDEILGGLDQKDASETKPDSARTGPQPSLLYQHLNQQPDGPVFISIPQKIDCQQSAVEALAKKKA